MTFPAISASVYDKDFREGYGFRAYFEFNVPSTSEVVIKVTLTTNFVLKELNYAINTGSLRSSLVVGGTEGGTFSTAITAFRRNVMTTAPTPAYVTGTTLVAGGTISGGSEQGVTLLKASGSSQQASTVSSGETEARGYPPGTTFYLRIQNVDNVAMVGLITALWAEEV